MLRDFRRDRWQYQQARVEVWSEKGTVRGTLAPVLYEYGVTLRVFHGYSSATSVREIAMEHQSVEKPPIAIYVGDYDLVQNFLSDSSTRRMDAQRDNGGRRTTRDSPRAGTLHDW